MLWLVNGHGESKEKKILIKHPGEEVKKCCLPFNPNHLMNNKTKYNINKVNNKEYNIEVECLKSN